MFVLMFFVWINANNKPHNKRVNNCIKISFIIFMTFNVMSSISFLTKEILYNYSTGYQTANYINENTKENSIFITARQPEFTTSIIPYIKNNSKFYYLQSEEYYTFITWDESITSDLKKSFNIEDLRKIFGENKEIYYIFTPYNMYEDVEDRDFINKLQDQNHAYPVFTSDKTFISLEEFVIYKINL